MRPGSDSAMSGGPHAAVGNNEETKKGESNILVALRMRPLLDHEITDGQFNLVKILDEKVVIL